MKDVTTITTTLSKVSAIFILICLILVAAYPALAQDATSTGTNRREKVQQKVETRKENVASKEAALKARLEAFKDKRKAQITERVNTTLGKINENQTNMMLKHLDKMLAILDKLEARVNEGKPDIKDPAAAKTAIASARAAIATATDAVKAQAEKDYTIQVTSESKVREDSQAVRRQLHTDLQAVRKQVIDAKRTVANAIRMAKSGSGAKEGTSSGTQ